MKRKIIPRSERTFVYCSRTVRERLARIKLETGYTPGQQIEWMLDRLEAEFIETFKKRTNGKNLAEDRADATGSLLDNEASSESPVEALPDPWDGA